MSSENRILTNKLNELSQLSWNEYMQIRDDKEISAFTHTIIAIIKKCTQKNPSITLIREAFNRLNGKPEKTIIIKVPKQYIIYPYAERLATQKEVDGNLIKDKDLVVAPTDESDKDMPTGALRQMLRLLGKMPISTCEMVLASKKRCETQPVPNNESPKVGAVIIANLLINGVMGNTLALLELFDQIDGKMADIVNIGGTEPIYITSYDLVAPMEATKNSDGVWFVEKKMIIRGVETNESE